MNKREEILNEVLVQNDQETERWTKYNDEQNVTITNLESFIKNLEVDVMVPIGPKALMPGKLCHTNEVFVSHYGKIFSKCTVFQAKKICEHRINMAKKQLEKLSTERELFENKLYIPHNEGVIPNDGEFEIIETYDEENEKLWKEKHKISLRESKRKEQIDNLEVSHGAVMQMLDEMELMDELETELNDLGIQDNLTLESLITGQIKVNEKKRISHLNNNNGNNKNTNFDNDLSSVNDKSLKADSFVDEITNNENGNGIENLSNNIQVEQFLDDLSDDSDNSSTYEIPKEIIAMEEKIEGLSTKKQIQFYKKNIKSIEKEISSLRISNPDDLEKKMHKIEIRDYLIDLVSILEDQIENDEIDIAENVTNNNKGKKNKKITFALEDEIKYIDNTEKVEDMFKKENFKKRDIITLNPEFELISSKNESTENYLSTVINKKDSIAEKVEKNLNFVQEMQSQEDFDLVGKILGTEKQNPITFNIKFHHSNQIYENSLYNNCNSNEKFQLGSPADFYTIFRDKYPQNLNTNMLYKSKNDTENKEEAYTDLRTELCTLQKQSKQLKPAISSILRNKKSVTNDINLTEPKTKNDLSSNYFDFDTIVGDVVENSISEPEPLPEEKFVDSYAPKKRISRFKQSRTMKTV